jgi:hypothetical protein
MIHFVRLDRFVSPFPERLGSAQVSDGIVAVAADQYTILINAVLARESLAEACSISREWLAW